MMAFETLSSVFTAGCLIAAVLAIVSVKGLSRGYFFVGSLLSSYFSTVALMAPLVAMTHSSTTVEFVEPQYLLLTMVAIAMVYLPIGLLLLSVAIHYEKKGTTQTVLGPTLD